MLKFISTLGLVLLASGAAAQSCTEIRFAPGASSGVVSENIGFEEYHCYRFSSGAGQTATLKLSAGLYVCFTIRDVVDCQGEYVF